MKNIIKILILILINTVLFARNNKIVELRFNSISEVEQSCILLTSWSKSIFAEDYCFTDQSSEEGNIPENNARSKLYHYPQNLLVKENYTLLSESVQQNNFHLKLIHKNRIASDIRICSCLAVFEYQSSYENYCACENKFLQLDRAIIPIIIPADISTDLSIIPFMRLNIFKFYNSAISVNGQYSQISSAKYSDIFQYIDTTYVNESYEEKLYSLIRIIVESMI